MRNEIIKNYMRYLKLGRNFSKNTLDAYYHDLNFLLEYADKNNEFLIVSMSSPTEEIGRAYHIVDVSTRETVITGSDILTVDNYIFVI